MLHFWSAPKIVQRSERDRNFPARKSLVSAGLLMVGYAAVFSSICNTSAKEMCVSGDLALYVLVSDRLPKPPLENGDIEVNTFENILFANGFKVIKIMLFSVHKCLFKDIMVTGI